MRANYWLYLLVAALVTFAIRALPMFFIRKPIRNRFIRSFLYYVPFVTLSVMVFPAIVTEPGNLWVGIGAMVIGVITAWLSGNLFLCASSVCIITLVLGLLLH